MNSARTMLPTRKFGDYCDINLDEDEMEKFLTQNMKTCHYFQLDDEYGIVRKQN